MQDSGPDMEELLNNASEDYPLKTPGDRWDVIQEAIVHQRQTSGNKITNLKLLLIPFLLSALVLAGLVIGDSEKILIGKTQFGPTSSSHKTDNVVTAKTKHAQPITDETAITNRSNSLVLLAPKSQLTSSGEWRLSNGSKKVSAAPWYLNKPDVETNVLPSILFGGLSEPDKLQSASRKQKKGFYYGIIAGLDMNAVKDQPFGNSNFEVGAIAGYQISRRVSLETGISLVKKYYNTKGKYFSMDDMPGGAEMMEVDGNSKIIRIPLNIQIHLIDRKYKVFASSGVSSYLMTEENNEYHMMMNGTEDKMYGSYPNNRNYFAATVDFSIGVEKQIGVRNQLRFQPYLQLPLKGVGVGKLPITSAGIRIGFMRNH